MTSTLKPPGINLPDGYGRASVSRSTTQAVANNTVTSLIWTAEAYDTSGIVNITTFPTRVATAEFAGVYLVSAQVAFATNATGYRGVYIVESGTFAALDVRAPVTGVETVFSVSAVLSLVAGDYVEVQVVQTSGGSLNVDGNNAYGAAASIVRLA